MSTTLREPPPFTDSRQQVYDAREATLHHLPGTQPGMQGPVLPHPHFPRTFFQELRPAARYAHREHPLREQAGVLLGFAMLLGGVMALSNPGPDAYAQWLHRRAVAEARRLEGHQAGADVQIRAGALLLGSAIERGTTRTNFLLLSLYETRTPRGTLAMRAVGAFGRFLPLRFTLPPAARPHPPLQDDPAVLPTRERRAGRAEPYRTKF